MRNSVAVRLPFDFSLLNARAEEAYAEPWGRLVIASVAGG